jgi:hypothetical protein
MLQHDFSQLPVTTSERDVNAHGFGPQIKALQPGGKRVVIA